MTIISLSPVPVFACQHLPGASCLARQGGKHADLDREARMMFISPSPVSGFGASQIASRLPRQGGAHVPEEVEGQLLGLLLAGYIPLLVLPQVHCPAQLVCEGQLQLVLTDVLLHLHAQRTQVTHADKWLHHAVPCLTGLCQSAAAWFHRWVLLGGCCQSVQIMHTLS